MSPEAWARKKYPMFSFEVRTHLDIEAQPEAVWSVLTDFAAYDDWNPMLRRVQGALRPGSAVKFEVQLGNGGSMKLRAHISRLEEPWALSWRGGSPLLISGEHYFRVERLDDTRVRFHNGERFAGPLFPLLARKLKGSGPLYESMNLALQRRLAGYPGEPPGRKHGETPT